MTYRSARLTAEHDTAAFECGVAVLDEWLHEQALRAERAGISATTVWTRPPESRVLAFYTIAPTIVSREQLLAKEVAAGFSAIAGYLLGRLALDRALRGKGLGSQLLLDALDAIVAAADRGGGRVIVVDATDDAAVAFYEHHNFVRVGDTRRLAMKIATARNAIDSS
ncbi:MAG: GNAT family N-acetyltransferase [Solirubrobacterales bacterium]